MGQSHPKIKDVADKIVGTNTEDGVATILEEITLGNITKILQQY